MKLTTEQLKQLINHKPEQYTDQFLQQKLNNSITCINRNLSTNLQLANTFIKATQQLIHTIQVKETIHMKIKTQSPHFSLNLKDKGTNHLWIHIPNTFKPEILTPITPKTITKPTPQPTPQPTPKTPTKPLKTHGIPVIIHDSLDYEPTFKQLQLKFPNTNFINIRPRLNKTFNKLTTRQQEQFINIYGQAPNPYDKKGKKKRSAQRAIRSVKDKTLSSTAWYYTFNFNHITIITPYDATISTTDSGNSSINKPKLPRLYSSIAYAISNGSQDPDTQVSQLLTLVDSSTFSRTKITRGTQIDQALTDLTSQILTDPIPSFITEPTDIPDELQDLAQLYDISIPTRTLILHSTYQQPYHTTDKSIQPRIKNTYTNMYPRQYTTEDQLNELRDIIKLYTDYGIITPEETSRLRKQRNFEREINNLTPIYETFQIDNYNLED